MSLLLLFQSVGASGIITGDVPVTGDLTASTSIPAYTASIAGQCDIVASFTTTTVAPSFTGSIASTTVTPTGSFVSTVTLPAYVATIAGTVSVAGLLIQESAPTSVLTLLSAIVVDSTVSASVTDARTFARTVDAMVRVDVN